ncbi:MAG: sugar phosphate isomerase/epimerase [Sedimentisphaerales bacterium]|nr:sugar phosphate isomerase/epimerase [Sedimentisphaerales bacterium]
MIKCLDWQIGVCAWSLGNDFDKIAALAKQTGLGCVHLAIAPAMGADGDSFIAKVAKNNLTITATMINFVQEDYSTLESIKATGGIVPDGYWQVNRKTAFEAIKLTGELEVKYLSMHFGFIELKSKKLLDRAKMLADKAGEHNVTLLMETGQESAQELREFLEKLNHAALGVNFDPANMILYDKGNPVEAVRVLSPWIKHVHIKDALRTKKPGEWGTEVAWGTGEVDAAAFLSALKHAGFAGVFAVEREAGDDRFGDIKSAIDKLKIFKD